MILIVKNETTMVDTGRMSRVTLHYSPPVIMGFRLDIQSRRFRAHAEPGKLGK